MRISDWSSDVCSSDLLLQAPAWTVAGLGLSATLAGVAKLPSNLSSTFAGPLGGWLAGRGGGRTAPVVGGLITMAGWVLVFLGLGRASCREGGCQYVSISGVAVSLQKKNRHKNN